MCLGVMWGGVVVGVVGDKLGRWWMRVGGWG